MQRWSSGKHSVESGQHLQGEGRSAQGGAGAPVPVTVRGRELLGKAATSSRGGRRWVLQPYTALLPRQGLRKLRKKY